MRGDRPSSRSPARAAAVLAIAALAAAGYVALPWFVTREAIVKGDSVSVETGGRDRVFYRSGWSPPHNDGVTVRVSRGERASVHFPLPAKRAYEIVLRLDPVAPDSQDRVAVLFNRQMAGLMRLKWNPERVGSYPLTVPEHMVRAGSNELTLVPESDRDGRRRRSAVRLARPGREDRRAPVVCPRGAVTRFRRVPLGSAGIHRVQFR